MTKKIILLTLLSIIFTAPSASQAKDPSVDDIIKRTNLASYYKAKDGRAHVNMKITDNQGRSRSREFTVLRRDVKDGGDQEFYIHFHAPADVAKMSFLVKKHVGQDDDRWLYLPALDLEKQIAAADKRTSFAGSDFFYEDISGRGIEEDEHTLKEITKNYYVLKNTPKKPGSVEFSYFIMYIHKTSFLPMKVEFYDKQERLHRVMQVSAVKKIQGHVTVTEASMEDKKSGSKTVVSYDTIKYDMGLPDKVFKKRSLRRAPTKYFK